MSKKNTKFSSDIQATEKTCPIGQTIGKNILAGKIPILSCEGAYIRGEIARLAANMITKQELFARCCHGELPSVPDAAMAQ